MSIIRTHTAPGIAILAWAGSFAFGLAHIVGPAAVIVLAAWFVNAVHPMVEQNVKTIGGGKSTKVAYWIVVICTTFTLAMLLITLNHWLLASKE